MKPPPLNRAIDAPPAAAGAPSLTEPELTVIEPPRGVSLRLGDLWRYRELGWFLVLRSVKPRYRQTILGVGWAVVPPFVLMVVFSIFLNGAANVPSAPDIPYPVFSYSGLLIWQYFSSATTRGATSLLANAAFLTKIYFPRVLIPLSTVISGLFDLMFAFVVLIPLMLVYGVVPGWEVVTLPAFILLAVLAAFAASLWLSAASVQFRDLSLAVPLAVQVGLFATPVIYPVTILPEFWQTVMEVLNPMATVVEGFRWALLEKGQAPGWEAAASTTIVLVSVLGGLLFFNRMERTYADDI